MNSNFRSLVGDRGRRHFNIADERDRWDYLIAHDKRNTISEFREPGSLRNSKFSKGFYRRPASTIWDEEHGKRIREKDEDEKYERQASIYQIRQAHLESKSNTNGNLISGENLRAERRPGKRHFNREPTAEQMQEALARDRTSIYRFYVSDRKKKLHENRNVKQSSTIVGLGRADIPSRGVLDNFTGHGYNSRPHAIPVGNAIPKGRRRQPNAHK